MCGALLFGSEAQSTTCNRVRGPPLGRDGNPIVTADGEPDGDAQPPFLLRFSPSVLAEEVPSIFGHDRATNRLYLRQGVDPPWVVKTVDGKWEYCKDCGSQYLGSQRAEVSRALPGQGHSKFHEARLPQTTWTAILTSGVVAAFCARARARRSPCRECSTTIG